MRSTEGKLLPIPFASGMDESTGTRSSATPRLYRVRNMRTRSMGTLEKRNGTRALPGTTEVPSGTEYCLVNGGGVARPTEHGALVTRVGDQLIAGTTGGYAYSWAEDANGWKFRGAFSTCEPIKTQSVLASSKYVNESNSIDGSKPSSVAMNAAGYTCFASHFVSTSAAFTVISPNGVEIYAATISSIRRVRVVNTGVSSTDGFVVVYEDNTGAIKGITVAIVSGAAVVTAAATIVATFATTWDVSGYDQTQWLLVSQPDAAHFEVYSVAGTTAGAAIVSQNVTPTALTIYGDTTNAGFWVGYLNNGGVDVGFMSATLAGATIVAATLLATGTVSPSPPVFGPMNSAASPTSVVWAYSRRIAATLVAPPSPVYTRYTLYGTCTTGGAVTTLGRMGSVIPFSRPDSKQRLWVATALETADTFDNFTPFRVMLVRLEGLSDMTVVELATELFGNLGTYSPASTPTEPPTAIASDGSSLGMAINVPVTTETVGTTQTPLFHARLYQYRNITQRAHAKAGLDAVITGQPATATTLRFAGSSSTSAGITEIGYPFAPSILYTEQVSGTGPGPGSYAYVVVFEWADENGNRVLSAPSVPRLVELLTENQVQMTIATPYGIGEKTNNLSSAGKPVVKVYRTTAGGTNYQRVGGLALVDSTPAPGTLFYADNVADADLADEEFVYTDGAVLPNQLAPSSRFVAAAEDRIWCGGLWDPTLLEASKVRVPGEPINFTGDASHQVVLPEPCTGLAYMDGQVVAFASSSIYLVGGDGPNDQGAGSFLPPRMLSRTIGCIEPRSIVETEIGIFFQSDVGIYLLPRGFGAPVLLSEPIHESLDDFPDILAATATSTKDFRVVRFLAAASGGTSATHVYTFDLDAKQWFLDDFSASNATYGGFSALGPWDDGCAFLRYDLTSAVSPLWAEDASYYGDEGAAELSGGSTFVEGEVQTTWIYPFGIGGWGRVNKALMSLDHVYGSSVSTPKVALGISIEQDDLASTFDDAWDIPTSSVSASYRGLDLTGRLVTAVRATVTLSEASVAGTGTAIARGPKMLGITFEIGPDGGDNGIRPTVAGTERS